MHREPSTKPEARKYPLSITRSHLCRTSPRNLSPKKWVSFPEFTLPPVGRKKHCRLVRKQNWNPFSTSVPVTPSSPSTPVMKQSSERGSMREARQRNMWILSPSASPAPPDPALTRLPRQPTRTHLRNRPCPPSGHLTLLWPPLCRECA